MSRKFIRRKTKTAIDDNLNNQDNKQNLTTCQKCNDPSAPSTYRPLVNEFLCRQCYKHYFPASALHDGEGSGILSNLGGKVMKKLEQRRDAFPEEEECRLCLERGKYRRCCKNYYCRDCFLKKSTCPGCNTIHHQSGVTVQVEEPSTLAVLTAFVSSILIFFIFAGLVVTMVINNVTKPETVWLHKCNGWFPTCNLPVCIDYGNIPSPMIGMPVHYEYCNISTSESFVIGDACVFDSELYRWSKEKLGFDVCSESPYSHGVFVMYDDFNYWANTTNYNEDSILMKSAKWELMQNAEATTICGTNNVTKLHQQTSHFDSETGKKNAALVFSGVSERFAETKDLDLRYGGKVQFYLKLAPVVENELATECKSAFSGDVGLAYSTNQGESWTVIRIYPLWKYRGDSFQMIEESIPELAMSPSTRLKFYQESFDPQRDFFALDDVQVFSFFDPEYNDSTLYSQQLSNHKYEIQKTQCEYDTEQCKTFPNLGQKFRLKIVEIYLSISCGILLLKMFFDSVHQYELNKSSTKDEVMDEVNVPLKTDFQLASNKKWKLFAMTVLWLPFIASSTVVSIHFVEFGEYYTKSTPAALFLALAVVMDFSIVRFISMDVFETWIFHLVPKLTIDATTENMIMSFKDEEVQLIDIRQVQSLSKRFCWFMFVMISTGALPFASVAIFLKAMPLTNNVYSHLLQFVGVSCIIRSILGPLWLVQIVLSIRVLYLPKFRKSLGRSMNRPFISHISSNTTFAALILAVILLFWSKTMKSATFIVTILLSSIFLGLLIGTILGILRDQSVVPRITFTDWPKDTLSIEHDRRRKLPHLLSRILAAGSKSNELIMLAVTNEERDSFLSLLHGETEK
ncbi:hypothetical protein CTEN210_17244 [Chaetoceros tenuissimus]|uniref:Reelin n=1 Tax=Chaetoceros tenuissimus TaxID=426638 RepID=A0AAD3HF71_9STRA|nr:hypothetical protein CTEN210_17244 [Chaetoceros tenuissimus]